VLTATPVRRRPRSEAVFAALLTLLIVCEPAYAFRAVLALSPTTSQGVPCSEETEGDEVAEAKAVATLSRAAAVRPALRSPVGRSRPRPHIPPCPLHHASPPPSSDLGFPLCCERVYEKGSGAP